MKKLLLAGAALAGLAFAPAAEAALSIDINGSTVATDPTNTNATFAGAIGGFNINVVSASGVNAFGGNGTLMDNGSLNISTSGAGSLTIVLTQTDLSLGAGTFDFSVHFSGLLTNVSVTRSWYLDAANTGAQATLLGTTTVGNADFTGSGTIAGLFSLTEVITVTATGPGATLSSDDAIRVPEPLSLALLGTGLIGLAAVRRRRG